MGRIRTTQVIPVRSRLVHASLLLNRTRARAYRSRKTRVRYALVVNWKTVCWASLWRLLLHENNFYSVSTEAFSRRCLVPNRLTSIATRVVRILIFWNGNYIFLSMTFNIILIANVKEFHSDSSLLSSRKFTYLLFHVFSSCNDTEYVHMLLIKNIVILFYYSRIVIQSTQWHYIKAINFNVTFYITWKLQCYIAIL